MNPILLAATEGARGIRKNGAGLTDAFPKHDARLGCDPPESGGSIAGRRLSVPQMNNPEPLFGPHHPSNAFFPLGGSAAGFPSRLVVGLAASEGIRPMQVHRNAASGDFSR